MQEKKVKFLSKVVQSGSWKGRRCFLIGGGPSLKCFKPARIENELTIGINKSIIKFNPTINYSMDIKFHDSLLTLDSTDPEGMLIKERWNNYKGIKVFLRLTPKQLYMQEVYLVEKIHKRTISFDLDKGIYPGGNSGFGALMLAIALGANPIYLLGYDLKTTENRTHWHNGYPHQDSVEVFSKKLDKYKRCFERYAPKIAEKGVDVINLNLESNLECFSKNSFANII